MQGWLAEGLRVIRARQGLTLVQAAEKIGVDRHTLRDLELGRRGAYLPTVEKIAAGYGIPVEDLLEEPAVAEKGEAPEAAGPADEARLIDASPAEFHRRLSEARSEEALLDLFRRIDAEYLETELTYRADEDNRTAYRDYAHAIERHMMAVLSLNIRGVLPPDPERLALQARKLEKLRK